MFQKILSLMLAVLLLGACLAACASDAGVSADTTPATDTSAPAGTPTPTPDPEPDEEPGDEEEENGGNAQTPSLSATLALNASAANVRLLGGRTYATESQIICDQAGSGVEFALFNTGKTMTFSVETSGPCYFRVYANGVVVNSVSGDAAHFVSGKGMVTLSGLKGGDHTIRLVKLSGAETATAALDSVLYTGTLKNDAPTGEDGYFEFIGGTLPSDDVMLSDAYAFATAQEAEYSILSELSALCGDVDVAAAYALRSSKRDGTAYDFAKKSKVVIIDLGAADKALSATDSTVTPAVFAEKYEALIETVIAKNSTTDAPCRVVCIYDPSLGAFAEALTELYDDLGRQTGGVYLCTRDAGEDGVMSATEQAQYMTRLSAMVALAMAGTVTDKPMTNGGTNGSGLNVSYKDFVEVTMQTYQSYSLNSSTPGVKILGERNLASVNGINCDWSCSGIELSIAHSGGDVIFNVAGDNAMFRVWVDGEEWENTDGSVYYIYGTQGSSKLTVPNVPMGTHTIRVVKVTSIERARNQITSVSLKGTLKEDVVVTDSDLYIEFIGDSISCGWGVVGTHDGDYKNMDGTLATPYLVSQELGADYSVTALSGQGLLQGTPGIPTGYLYAAPFKNETESGKYDFARQADIVVINIGTNDEIYGSDRAAFEQAYKDLLATIKEKNGADCKIVCVYNTMVDTYSTNLLAAVAAAGGETAGIYTLKLDRCSNAYHTSHPTAEENVAYTEDIIDFMESKGII